MVDDADHGQRLCKLRQQPDRLPGRLSPGAAFRRQRRSGGQLRRDRLCDRPRDQPPFRRSGQPLRSRRPAGPAGGPRRISRRFRERTQRLVAQYDGYEALPGLNIRGSQTLGENIADNAGLAVAYDAYQLSLGGRPAPVIDGTTGDAALLHGPRPGQQGRLPRGRRCASAVIGGVHSPSRGAPGRSATTTPGTRRSTSAPASASICRRSSASASGSRLLAARLRLGDLRLRRPRPPLAELAA